MEDRELLELAAKAAGAKIKWRNILGKEVLRADFGEGFEPWNPWADDGDSRRLEVALSLRVECRPDGHVYVWRGEDLLFNEFAFHENNPKEREAATRRTVLRAAAEIGKRMQ